MESAPKQLVGTDEDALQSTVDYEVPSRAVPQAADEEAEPKVEVFACFGLHTATAQGEVKIVLDEHAEGLVPTPPKLRDGGGYIRVVEVLWELETHHATQTDGHVRISCKVEIDRQRWLSKR